VADPGRDDGLGLLVRFEPMLPHTFELERTHEQFGDAVLLGRVGQDELLAQAVRLGQGAVELRSVDEGVVRPQRDAAVSSR
jgi:hypothetical protein